jgi:uncharacterized membrane protein
LSRFPLLLTAVAAIALAGGAATAATSSEADRAEQKREQMIAKLEKKYGQRLEACSRGQTAACAEANRISGEIALLRKER